MITCVNLMQPWADAVIEGKLPILARRFPIKIRGTIGIAATGGIDGIFLNCLSDSDLKIAERQLEFNQVIGSVCIEGCLSVSKSRAWEEMSRIGGEDLSAFYPIHFMPKSDPIYFWVISNPIRFKMPLPIVSKGITWSKAENDSNSQMPSRKRKTFWIEANYNVFKDFNVLLRKSSS